MLGCGNDLEGNIHPEDEVVVIIKDRKGGLNESQMPKSNTGLGY